VLSNRAELASVEDIRALIQACDEQYGALHIVIKSMPTKSWA